MPFGALGSFDRSLHTRDADEATAFMGGNIRPGLVNMSSSQSSVDFEGRYFSDADFMVGYMEFGSGWSFDPLNELDVVMVWIGLDGDIRVMHADTEAQADRNSILITSARSTNRIVAGEPYKGFVIGVCSNIVREELANFLGYRVDTPLDFINSCAPSSPLGAGLQVLGSALHAGLSGHSPLLSSPIALRRHRDAFVNMTLLAAGADKVAAWGGRLAQCSVKELRRAEDFMRAHAIEPIGIGDVAAHVGISTRALQYLFRRHRDTTPLAVLHQARLEGVRSELATGEQASVTSAATRWGFSHLGRFARQYKAAFGESPSAAVARRRARHW